MFKGVAYNRLVNRLKTVTLGEGVNADTNALHKLAVMCNNDIRYCLNTLQFLKTKAKYVIDIVLCFMLNISGDIHICTVYVYI